METAQDIKRRLRLEMLAKRRSLPADFVAAESRKIAAHFCAWPAYRQAGTVMLYLAMPDEPQMFKIIDDALASGKTVCVPLLSDNFRQMQAARITSLDELVTGRLGLKMPDPVKAEIVAPEQLELVAVPGVAFDAAGNRLGMGAGYYDIFLPKAPGAVLVGVAWDFQLDGSVPREEHDVRLHYLLTETGLRPCAEGAL